MQTVDINYMAVIVSTVIGMVLGALWYSPVLFANAWMKATGRKKEDVSASNATRGYVIAVIANLLTAYVLAHFVQYAGATTFAEGMLTGFWAWLGFVATVSTMNDAFEDRPAQLTLINVGMQLVALVIMGGLLAVWR